MKMTGVSANSNELLIESEGPLVKVTAGFAETGTAYLTPEQAGHAAEMLMLAAAEARKQSGWLDPDLQS